MGTLAKDPDPPRRRNRSGSTCQVLALLGQLDAEDGPVVLGWIQSKHEYPAAGVAAKLVEHGHHISKASIERHRRRDCNCRIDRPDLYE